MKELLMVLWLGAVAYGIIAAVTRYTFVCDRHETVAEVGGCDRSGLCGVRYESGGYGSWSHPVKGQSVCTASRMVWN